MEKKRNEGHRERLRERFFRHGLDSFSDYEIIELLLTLSTPRKDCKPQAKEALKRFKNLRGVVEAPPEELEKIDGIGPVASKSIKIVYEISKRYLKENIKKRDPFKSSAEVYDYLVFSMRDLKKEVFKTIFLNAQNSVVETEDTFEGSLTSSAIYPREIVKSALKHHAAGLIFAHNHPSGNPSPSFEDKEITKKLIAAGDLLQIKVIDHIIVGDNRYYSFADNGLMEELRNT